MREYSTTISLTNNSRGIFSIDPSIGCSSGMQNELGGCYNDCYAAKSSKLYGYDFSKTVLRDFKNELHKRKTVIQINKISLPFIRMGTSGDPSENWEHTIKILKQIENCNKEIVLIVRHWQTLTDEQLQYLSTINVCINTSISALDKNELRERCLQQFKRITPYCKSVLRIVSCDFNLNNNEGLRLSKIQHELFKNHPILDTVLRVNKNNEFVKSGIINVKKSKFLGKNAIISKYNKKTYFGKCSTCIEMCGVKLDTVVKENKKKLVKQASLF